MAHMATAEVVVRDQQSYAKQHDIPGVFEGLTIALLYKKPQDPIAFISEEANRMSESKSYEPTSVSAYLPSAINVALSFAFRELQPGREADTQVAAIKYLDDNNIHAIMEVRCVVKSAPCFVCTFVSLIF